MARRVPLPNKGTPLLEADGQTINQAWFDWAGYIDAQVQAFLAVGSAANPGYQRLPSGLIIQWGSGNVTTNASSATAITFPIAFPIAVFTVIPIDGNDTLGSGIVEHHVSSMSATGFIIITRNTTTAGGLASATVGLNWVAIGN